MAAPPAAPCRSRTRPSRPARRPMPSEHSSLASQVSAVRGSPSRARPFAAACVAYAAIATVGRWPAHHALPDWPCATPPAPPPAPNAKRPQQASSAINWALPARAKSAKRESGNSKAGVQRRDGRHHFIDGVGRGAPAGSVEPMRNANSGSTTRMWLPASGSVAPIGVNEAAQDAPRQRAIDLDCAPCPAALGGRDLPADHRKTGHLGQRSLDHMAGGGIGWAQRCGQGIDDGARLAAGPRANRRRRGRCRAWGFLGMTPGCCQRGGRARKATVGRQMSARSRRSPRSTWASGSYRRSDDQFTSGNAHFDQVAIR